jgi:hypothetical protein
MVPVRSSTELFATASKRGLARFEISWLEQYTASTVNMIKVIYPHQAGSLCRRSLVSFLRSSSPCNGGVIKKAGVTGVGSSVKYMFVILDPTKVVLAVLGVTGSKPFHSLACWYRLVGCGRRSLHARWSNSTVMRMSVVPKIPMATPIPIAVGVESERSFSGS